jgi:hypothetical protein
VLTSLNAVDIIPKHSSSSPTENDKRTASSA